eukprot:178335_1
MYIKINIEKSRRNSFKLKAAVIVVCVIISLLLFISANSSLNISTIISEATGTFAYYQCDIFIKYGRIATASTFTNGVFEHYFNLLGYSYSSSSCSMEDNTVSPRAIQISKFPFDFPESSRNNNNTIYVDVGHEYCLTGPNSYNDSLPQKYKIIAYNYFDSKNFTNRKAIYLPLFLRYDIGDFKTDIFPVFDNYHKHSKIFTHRIYLLSIIMSLETGNRKKYTSVYNSVSDKFGKNRIFLNLIKHWKINNDDYKVKKPPHAVRYINGERYRNTLINSQFNLCVDGNNPESYRIMETLSTIPIVSIGTGEYLNHSCSDALDPFILHGNSSDDMNINKTFVERYMVFSKETYKKWYYYSDHNEMNLSLNWYRFWKFLYL